jgi:vancomycin resistance protein YoaR
MREYSALHVPAEGHALGRTKSRTQGRRLRHNKLAELLAAICVAMLFTVCGAAIYCAGLLDARTYYDSISIDDLPVGGLTREEALERFSALNATTPAPIQVTAGGKSWEITAGGIGARYSVAETIDTAWNVGRKGNVLQRLGDILALRSIPQNFMFTVLYDDDKLRAAAERIAREASTAPVNASLQFQPDTESLFAVTGEVNGRIIGSDALYKQMQQTLGKRIDTKIAAELKLQPPEITAAKLREQTQLIGACTTVLTEDAVRNSNIKLAAAAVNGTVLLPGAEFSFNTLTGERTAEKGYSEASAISGGKLVDEVGGGVCQVSSTVYDAALLAGLEVVERHPHSWEMYYVKAGLDAMVDYGSRKDLRLKNGAAVSVYLVVRVDVAKRTVTAEVYGLPSQETITLEQKDYTVITPEKPAEKPNSAKPIGWSNVTQEERKGCRVSIYRVFTSGGDTRRELLYNDYYPPVQGRIEIGTKSPSSHNK